MLLSQIISKQVLNLFSGKIEGTIFDVSLNNNSTKINQLFFFNEDEEEFTIQANKIYTIGKDAVVIKNFEAISSLKGQTSLTKNSPINKDTFSLTGDYLGKIKDIQLDDKLKIIKFETTTNFSFTYKQLLNIGEKIIIKEENEKVTLSSLKPKIIIQPTIKFNEKVSILAPQIEENVNETDTNRIKIDSSPSPKKIISDSNFLLGRKVIKNIYGLNNEIIVKQNSTINEKNLELAKLHSKLTELTIYSKAIK